MEGKDLLCRDGTRHKILNLNVVQIFNLTRACMPLLEKASNGAYDPSKVINIGVGPVRLRGSGRNYLLRCRARAEIASSPSFQKGVLIYVRVARPFSRP